MMTTVDEVNRYKTKEPEIFVLFGVIVLVPNSMSKLIHNRYKLTFKLLINAYVYANEQLGPCFYVLVRVVQLWNYTETIIRLRLGEYCRIITSTSSRGLFYNIYLAFGE